MGIKRLCWSQLTALTLTAAIGACAGHQERGQAVQGESGRRAPAPLPTLASVLARFPLDDLPRKTSDGFLIQIENAKWGLVGPNRVTVAVVPLNGGGNRTSLLGIYGVRDGKPVGLQRLDVGDLRGLEVHDGRIIVYDGIWGAGEGLCCLSHAKRLVYSFANQSVHLEDETTVTIATPAPPAPSSVPGAATSNEPTSDLKSNDIPSSREGRSEGTQASSSSVTHRTSCYDAALKFKSDEGDVIGTDDGRTFHVMPGDESTVLTCDVRWENCPG